MTVLSSTKPGPTVATPGGSTTVPPVMNVNLQLEGHLLKSKSEIAKVAEPIIKILGILLFVGVGVVLMSHSILTTAIVEEVTRMLFLCALGLIIERGLGKKTRVQFGAYTFELGG